MTQRILVFMSSLFLAHRAKIALFVSSLLLSFSPNLLQAADSSSPVAPRKAPELEINLPGGNNLLLSKFRGKVVALEIIQTTCPHCQAASKFMSELQNKYGSKGLQVIAAAINPNADLLVENFIKDYKVTFPVGWLNPGQAQTFMQFSSAYFVVPQLALVDRTGSVRFQTPAKEDPQWDELMNHETLVKNVELLLNEKPSAHKLMSK